MESSSSSSKRAKAPGHITQVAHCLVDGCNADLSLCRDYHRRHKVCEVHSKTPKVTIGGREQRFCQQCSRFHSLVEFDEGKRSCRKRLEGHNRRRRKPQPDNLARNPALSFPSQQSTTRLLSFTTPQILQTAVVGSSWASRVVKPENEMMLFNNQQQLNYMDHRQNAFADTSAHNYKGVNQLQFIQEASICQSVIDPNADGLNEVAESDRALSLLSSAPSVTREFGLLNHSEPPLPTQAHQSLVHSLQYGGLGEYPVASAAAASHGSNASSTRHFPEMFEQGNEGSSTSGPHQTLTFMWE
ncbi:hypothetical protein BUALT_Bualt17G0016100 [Buddleja alternifolia]|uniref:SBP-type domain-containing protein n=1 Tax=Buddleja alternifolia TaxID=168488 RepID=A0AAV6W5I0_9LAMI|nr:hypothetical protein BUALT_Bualt17G0016100 [Buddleja alternifolia]